MNTNLISVVVKRKFNLAQDIVGLELVPDNSVALPAFEPGAHIDLYIPGGFIRQFSLLNDHQHTASYVIAVLREPESRGGSVAIHDNVNTGDRLEISQPRNRFNLVKANKSILFAGGIGVTPILCMVRYLQSQQQDFQLHYSCRTRARAAFLDELADLVAAGKVFLHFDDEPATSFDMTAVLRAELDKHGTHIYACGPSGYIDAVRSQAIASGFLDSNFHFEHFSLDVEDKPEISAEDFAFQVELSSTGEVFDIPADESITSALDRQGVYIPVSCEEGICGTCLTGVVSGRPDHRDTYLTEEEHAQNDQFTPCCSRSFDKLIVIDL